MSAKKVFEIMDDFKVSGFNPFELPKDFDYGQVSGAENEEKVDSSAATQQQGVQIDNNYSSSNADKDFKASSDDRESAIKAREEAQQALEAASSPEEVESAQKSIEQAEKMLEKAELAMGNANSDSILRSIDGWS